MISKQLVNN